MEFTPGQCRAARALIGWSQDELATASKVAKATIANFELGKRSPYDRTLDDLRGALEAAGVEFTDGNQPGVRMRGFRIRDRVKFGPDKAPDSMLWHVAGTITDIQSQKGSRPQIQIKFDNGQIVWTEADNLESAPPEKIQKTVAT
jgi:transcriptional regulator with XRE-family HTH domain